MTQFAEVPTSYPDGQQNVGQPPEAVLNNGFIPATATSRGQPLPAQWINWLFQKIFRLLNRDVVGTATGVGLFTVPNSIIRIEAYDKANPSRYLIAVGYKGAAGVVHALTVVSSSTLTLGTATISGNQPVNGGSDVVTVGYSRQIGDI